MQDVNLSGNGLGRSNSQWFRVALLLVLAAGLVALFVSAWRFRDTLEPFALMLGTIFAASGLLAILAWIAGMLQFAGTTAERPFSKASDESAPTLACISDAISLIFLAFGCGHRVVRWREPKEMATRARSSAW